MISELYKFIKVYANKNSLNILFHNIKTTMNTALCSILKKDMVVRVKK